MALIFSEDLTYSVDDVEGDSAGKLAQTEEESVERKYRSAELRHSNFRGIRHDRCADKTGSEAVGDFRK